MSIYFKPATRTLDDIPYAEAGLDPAALIRLPDPKRLYRQRMERFRVLAPNHPMEDFLRFCLTVTEIQAQLIEPPFKANCLTSTDLHPVMPLYADNYPLSHHWQSYLSFIIKELCHYPADIQDNCQQLSQMGLLERQQLAESLVHNQFDAFDCRIAMLIWAALSCYFVQLATQLPLIATCDNDRDRQFCPVCGSYPVASILPHSKRPLRYLHCSLCETEWHSVRLKCTNCNDLSQLSFYSLDQELAPIKTECCSQCSGYIKLFYAEYDPQLDVIADDLGSLLLDEEMEKLGFSRTTLNPYLFK